MELSLEMCEEITGICNFPRSATDAEGERRHHQRFPFGSRGTVWPMRKGVLGAPCAVLLRDISAGGVSFLNAESLKQGSEFVICFSGHQGRQIKVQCAVNRCEAGGSGGTQFVVGASFQAVVSTEEIPAEQPVEARKPVHAEPTFGRLIQRDPARMPAPAAAPAPAPVEVPQPVVVPAAAHFSTAPVEIARETQPEPEPAPEPEPQLAPEPEPIAVDTQTPAAAPEPVVAQAPAPVAEIAALVAASPIQVEETDMTISPSPASDKGAAGHNQELLARVKANVLKQNQSLQSQLQQLEDRNKQFQSQQTALAEMTQRVNDLQAKLAQSTLAMNEERQKGVQQTEATQHELAELRQTVKTLQIKSEADDKAIAELAGFFGAENAPQSNTTVAVAAA